jgi:hypothetical protein
MQSDGTYPISPNGYVSSDVIATDVLSFDVRLLVAGNTDFFDLLSLPGVSMTNSVLAGPVFCNGSTTPLTVKVFDTWSSVKDATFDYSGWNQTSSPSPTTIPLRTLTTNPNVDIQILAIQVSIRMWDYKTEQARQITVVVDM